MDKVRGHAANASEIARQLAQDKKFRKQLISAASHGSAAARRGKKGFGLVGAVTRLAADETLVNELKSARADLQRAYGRLETRKRSHKLRNSLLLVGAASVAAVPKVRNAVMSRFDKTAGAAGGPDTDTARPRSLEDLTKDELYERAQKADIPGRSDMTKDELVAALRRQG